MLAVQKVPFWRAAWGWRLTRLKRWCKGDDIPCIYTNKHAYEQWTKPIVSAKGMAKKVIVFCLPIVPEGLVLVDMK